MQTEDVGSFDAIIIGSGMAGLFAANLLAKKGRRVLLLEKHSVPGGYTTNFERKGFRFDASNHFIGGGEPGGMAYETLAKIGAEHRVEFLKHECFGFIVDEARGIEYHPPWQLNEYVDLLAKLFPQEESGIRGFYEKYESLLKGLFVHLANREGDSEERGGGITKAMEEYLGLKGKSAKDLMDGYVSEPELMGMMAGLMGGSLGVTYEELDATIFVMGEIASRMRGGFTHYPKGGSGTMTRTLAELFQENGGTLLLNREVTKLTFSNGLADGIIAKDRKKGHISARARCVVAACDLTTLVNKLCPQGAFPPDYVKSVNQRVPGRSCVMLFAGLDIDLRERGITDFEFVRTWGKTMTPSLLEEIMREGDYSKVPSAHVAIYSNLDPSCCPEGKSLITTIDLADPELFERSLGPGRKRGKAYKELKKRVTSQLLEKAARALGIPDLERHVEVLEVATPITLERYTGNRGGSFVGWKWNAEQAADDHFPQESPIGNLFLCGHWVSPGGGVNFVMASGVNAGEIADEYLRALE
jgi:phytoene dehydrogenase-like protein